MILHKNEIFTKVPININWNLSTLDIFENNVFENMNIFFLSMSIRRCAKQHFNQHVVKMILEYAQLLSCAWHMLDSVEAAGHYEKGLIYKKTHYNHPSAIWDYNCYDKITKMKKYP